MRGSDLAEAMASAVDRMVNAREGTGALDRAIEAVVGTIGRFTGKDATKYLASYGAEMLMRDIPEERRLAGFPRVAMPCIHAEVLRSFMEWVESPGKGRNASVLLREFEGNFAERSWIQAGSCCSSNRWTSGIGITWAPCWKLKTG